MSHFVHEKGISESTSVGEGTRVWAFAHVLRGAQIGRNCNVCDHVFIENDVVVGDDVTIKCGVQLWDGIRIGNGVFIGPNATFSNDRFPRSKAYPDAFAQTIVEDGASIGANATILPGVRIGKSAMIGAGAVVTRNVPANATVVGNPAVVVNYQTDHVHKSDPTPGNRNPVRTGVGESELWPLAKKSDPRGHLLAIDYGRDLPFVPQRTFCIFEVPESRVRGEHAHRMCHQFLIALSGSVVVMIDAGKERREVVLDSAETGLYVPPLIWGELYKFSPGAVLHVFASHPYDPADYIRDYSEFRTLVQCI